MNFPKTNAAVFPVEITFRISNYTTNPAKSLMLFITLKSIPQTFLWCLQTKRKHWALIKVIFVRERSFYSTIFSSCFPHARIKRSSGWPSWFLGQMTLRYCSRCSGTQDTRWKSQRATSRAYQSPPSINSSCHRNPILQVKACFLEVLIIRLLTPLFFHFLPNFISYFLFF